MDEEITIIDSNTRNEKIKNFFLKNKASIIIISSVLIIFLIVSFLFVEIKKKNKINLANQFNSIIIEFEIKKKKEIVGRLKNIVKKKDNTYSPLALYFLVDKKLIANKGEVNELFDALINETKLEKEIKNLIIYKKALYNSDDISENDLLKIINPIIKSDSIWKSHALYLTAEFFYSNNEKKKAKEFFVQILTVLNGNSDIKLKVQERLNRDFGE